MRNIVFAILFLFAAGLPGCAGLQKSGPDTAPAAPAYLSLNEYNHFVDAQTANLETLNEVMLQLANMADPQETYALSVLIETIETHIAMARNLADLAVLAGTDEFSGSPYVAHRYTETTDLLEADLGEIGMQNLALNKSQYKDVSAIFTGYLYDLEQLIKLIRADLSTLEKR